MPATSSHGRRHGDRRRRRPRPVRRTEFEPIVRAPRVRHHDRHGPGRRREVDVLVGLAERLQLGDHVDGDDPCPLERLHQAIATVHQLLDLFARQLAAARQLAQHPLAVGPGLVDHLATLLLGHRQLGLGVGRRIGTAAGGLDFGLLAHPQRLVARLAQQARRVLFGLLADLGRCLACGAEHACGLLAEQTGERRVVEADVVEVGVGLGRAELTLEEPLTLLQATEFGGDHPQEIADLVLVVAAPARAERGVGDRRR